MRPGLVAVSIVPTGLGASIGGYAGDAAPATNLLASACDLLITHPNALNAASLFSRRENVWYVEGAALDRFCLGAWRLRPSRTQRIGLLIDRAIADADPEGLTHLLTAADACRAVHGVDLIGWHATPERVDSRIVLGVDGTSFGELANPEALVAGGRFLLERGATAIALVTRMPEAPEEAVDAYLRGHGPDPIGGLEAILSHVLTLALQVPCAHAPYEPPEFVGRVDPRAAAESVGYTYLPCVLQGLAKAPDLAWSTDRASGPDRFPPWMGGDVQHGWVGFDQVGAVVAPWGACGGLPMFAAQAAGIPLIAVRDNLVATSADPRSLGFTNVIEVESYLAAAGALLALREGVAIAALQRPLAPLPCLSAVEASTTA